MTTSTLLVDPLAALFRDDLAGLPPLVLDETQVEVQMVAPLAHVTTIRRFTNAGDGLIEAVLTLPPLAPQEIVYRLVIRIDGTEYEAAPRASRNARRSHDAAIAQGRRAILYELLENDIPLISIAGIQPGARVDILTWSIRPLARRDDHRATLLIHLNAATRDALFRLPDADAPVTTPHRHAASLTVSWEAKRVKIFGQPYADRELVVNEAIGVECATPIVLEVTALEGGSLDHSEWQVEQPGGWEVTSQRAIETFRHPRNPEGPVISDRNDWIFGIMPTSQGDIRVTAPLPSDGTIAPGPHGMWGIAPNARAMRAFAAASFVEAATPQSPAAVLLAANVLSRRTSLAFIGPDGDLPDEIPTLRKLALARMESIDSWSEPLSPVALEPYPYEPPQPPDPPPLPVKENPVTPGARPPRTNWLIWATAGLALVVIATLFQAIDLPALPVLGIFAGLMIMIALRFLPRKGSPARRRLPLLLVLPLPWMASLLADVAEAHFTRSDAEWIFPLQYGLLAMSAVLPLALMPFMRDARRSIAILGVLNLVLTFFTTASSIIIHSPGS